jgi:molybdopterin molybdotransferase
MITTAEATQAISAAMPAFATETVPLAEAAGRILQQGVVAERDQPPFDRVTMDGIAVQYEYLASGNRRFTIQGTQHAGDPVQTLTSSVHAIEIMTGGVLPRNSDCIIPVERIEVEDGVAIVEDNYAAERLQFVHPQGSDYPAGHEVLRAGRTVSPMDVAIIASCGLEKVQVSSQPAVCVISTGNELVPPGRPVEPHQVRLSNGPALVAMLKQQGFQQTADEHLLDEPDSLRQRLQQILDEASVLILSGGVSMGQADYVPQVLDELGVKVVFHKISQRPGKPMWFGIGPDQQAVFALPGNPVSSLVCCRQYVLPALLQASGRDIPRADTAILAADVTVKGKLTCFMPVRLQSGNEGRLLATPVPTNTSGDFASLSGTDGYVELELERDEFPAGSCVPLHRWINP